MTISLSVQERPLASYRCQSTHGIDTRKFHGSFRLCFRLFCTFCIAHIEIAYSRTCHTATFTNFLCYTPVSRIQGKSAYFRDFPTSPWSLTPHHIIGLFLHRKRLFYTDHKDSAFDFSMMIHCKALLTVSISINGITSTGKNQLIQYLE